MNVRALTAAAVATAVLLGTAGCGVFVETATLKPYSAGDGVNATVGSIGLRNMLLITDESGDGSLIGTIVNDSGAAAHLTFELRGATALSETIASEPGLTLLGIKDVSATIFPGAELTAGQYATIYVQYGSADGVEVTVPVLDGTNPVYAPYTPTLIKPAPIPVVTETPAP